MPDSGFPPNGHDKPSDAAERAAQAKRDEFYARQAAERRIKNEAEAAARKTFIDYYCASILGCCSKLDRLNDSDAPDEHAIAGSAVSLLSWVAGAFERMDPSDPRHKGVRTKGERAHIEMDRLPSAVTSFYRPKFEVHQKRIDEVLTGYWSKYWTVDVKEAQEIEANEVKFLGYWRERMNRLTDPQALTAERQSVRQQHHTGNGYDHTQASRSSSSMSRQERFNKDWGPQAATNAALDGDLYRNIMDESDEQPEHLVEALVPAEVCGVFIGSGGAGKGITLQTLCTAVASQKPVPFLGYAVKTHGLAIFWTAEDRRSQLLSRERRICKALGIERSDTADRLVLRSHREPDCRLWLDGTPTQLLLNLLADAKRLKAKLLTIDSASLTYHDDEISRLRVGTFLRWLDLQAEEMGCTIIVVLHTSRSSDETVERLSSGSTAWVFQGRFALLLRKEDGEDDPSITVSKINYGKPGLKVDLMWTDSGVLKAKPAPGTVEHIAENADDKLVLGEIVKAWEASDPLVMKAGSVRHLPSFMARMGRMSQKRAKTAVIRLRDLGKIGPGRKGDARGLKPL